MTSLGLTWDHPRGYDALAAAAEAVNQGKTVPLIRWAKQPLEGFESAPIADLAARHDLLVLDHPHIGEAVAEDCLIALEDVFAADDLARWEAQSIGPSLASYRFAGRSWALPLDVATQVVARDLRRVNDAPGSWDEVNRAVRDHPSAVSVAGPHAILSVMSIAASMGTVPGGDDFLPNDVLGHALDVLSGWYAARVPGSETLNPIGLSEAMARGEIAFVPLLFGYVNYARAGLQNRIAYSDTPVVDSVKGLGGVLGGTGIAFTKRSQPGPELVDHVRWLMDIGTQTRFFPHHNGQPSARSAWYDPAVNEQWSSFYASTAVTAERALLRPRFDGYIAFQPEAAELVRVHLRDRTPVNLAIAAIRQAWQDARSKARGPLDDDRPQPNGVFHDAKSA